MKEETLLSSFTLVDFSFVFVCEPLTSRRIQYDWCCYVCLFRSISMYISLDSTLQRIDGNRSVTFAVILFIGFNSIWRFC